MTLLELVIAVGVGGILLAAAAAIIANSASTAQSNNQRLEAIRNVDTAGTWFIRDFQPAQILPQDVTLLPGSGNVTILQSVERPGDRTVIYEISSDGSLSRSDGSSTAVVAQHIASVTYSAGNAVAPSTANVSAVIGLAAITKTYKTASRITDFASSLSVVTDGANGIGSNNATLNGHIESIIAGTNAMVGFQYGTTSSYSASVPGVPASLNNVEGFLANISGLSRRTTYHYRAVAFDGASTAYGADATFTTSN